MWEWTNIRSHRKGNACGNLPLELANLVIKHRGLRGRLILRLAMMGEVVEDGEGWDGEDAFLAHETNGFVAKLSRVIDRCDAGLRGVERAGFPHGVNSDRCAQPVRLFHGCCELRRSVLIGRVENAVDHPVGPSLIDLREV